MVSVWLLPLLWYKKVGNSLSWKETLMQPYLYLLLLFYCQIVFTSLWPHGWQRFRVPCPLLYPGVCSNSCPLSWWCHPTILSSVPPFLLSFFPSITVFHNESALRIRGPKYWSFSFSISPSSDSAELISFRIDWFDSPSCPRDSRVFSSSITQKHQFFGA